MIVGCKNRDIRESYSITDLSKPTTLTFKLKSGNGNAGYRIKGRMNGTLGYSEGLFFEGRKFPSFHTANNLDSLAAPVLRDYVRVSLDSITAESNLSIGQSGFIYGLHFIPGTATEGKIEVEFWEHPTGFY
jgi:hypothetical protein